MLKFFVKVFRTSLFPNPLMDLVYIWYDDRYWSKILFSTIPTPMHDLKVKVTDLELLCWHFTLKYLGPHYFQTLWWILFIFGMMIDTGPKFYSVPSPPPCMTLRSRSRTLNFMLTFYVEVFRTSLFPNPLMDLFMFGVMIDTGPKFYTVPSPPPYITLRSRSQTWNFYVKVLS